MAIVAPALRGARAEQSTEREHGPSGSRFIAESFGTGNVRSDVDGSVTLGVQAHQSLPDAGGGATGHAHSWCYDGRSTVRLANCDRPSRFVCACGSRISARCSSTREGRCAPCAKSHRIRLKHLIVSGVPQVGQFFFVTITAPGADALPWDTAACGHVNDGSECSGSAGCRVEDWDAAVWNGTAPRRWSWFVTYLRRRLGELEYVGVWEDQERGVLHRHFLVRVARPTTEKRVRAAVRGSARAFGFGSQYDVRALHGDAAKEAWYIASYATKTVDRLADRPILDVRTGEMKRSGGGFRPWSCSRSWGDTMKSVKARQRAWALSASGAAVRRSAGCGADAGRSPALDPNSDISTWSMASGVDPCGVALDLVTL